MYNVCDFCLNYESKNSDMDKKTEDTCSNSCFKMNKDEGDIICENFDLVLCPDVSYSVIKRFLKQDINFYDNLCDLISIILTMFSYQTIFKIVFDIEHGLIEFLDLTNSQNSYGVFDLTDIELKKGEISFVAESEFRQIVLGVVEPDSLIFVEIKDFEHKYPIRGVFCKPNRFFNKDKLALKVQSFVGQEVW